MSFPRRNDARHYGWSGRTVAGVLAMAVAVAEAVGLRSVGMVANLPLAAQASAVPSLGAFHDVRWILVYATSWGVLAGELAAALVFRTVFNAVMVRVLWPDAPTVPAWGRLLGRNAVAAVLLLVAMSPWGVLSFVTGVSSLSFPLLGGLFGSLVVGVLATAHAGITPRWWARWPSWRAMGWTAADFASVTAAAIGIDYSPGWVVLLAVAAGALLDAWCWGGLVRAGAAAAARAARATAPSPGPRARRVLVPLSLAVVVAGIPVGAASGVPPMGQGYPPAHRQAQDPPPDGRRALMLADGFQSNWQGNRPADRFPGFYTTQFSYAGLSASGRPLPYPSAATTQSLPRLAAKFARQVTRLHRLTHKTVDVVAISEGTYVVRQYLATHRRPPLHVVVLASPLPRPDRAYYPPVGSNEGYGIAAGWETHLLLEVSLAEAPHEDIRTGMPMIRSLIRQAPEFRQRSLCPVPGVRVVALLPLTAAVDTPPGPVAGIPTGVMPSVHGTLVSSGGVRKELLGVLEGQPLSRYFGWGLAFQVARYAASAWEVPSLPLTAVPAWRHHGGAKLGDAAFGTYGCPSLDHPSVRIDGRVLPAPRHRS